MNRFVLTGPRKGQTISLVGIDFVNGVGECNAQSKEDLKAIAYHLGTFYGAFHESVAEEAQAHYERTQAELKASTALTPPPETLVPEQPVVQKQDLTPRSTPEQDAEKAAAEKAAAEKAAAEKAAAEKAAAEKAAAEKAALDALGGDKPTLAEAIQGLDADKDEHWTARGLPSVDALVAIIGAPVTRDEIEAAASGFTRTAAKVAKAA